MPSFNPFTSSSSRNCSLFEIRLDNDFIVLRGNDHEASGQLLKGVVVLCLRESLKVEDIHLRLMGHCRLTWVEDKDLPMSMHNSKADRTSTVLKHNWTPFVGETNHHNTLGPGNYEWPFETMIPGDTPESVEGLQQTGITYALKATVSRGKLAKNLHAYKRLRIIRTMDPTALELNHVMSVDNIWPEKMDYSVAIAQKAIVFGTSLPLEMRFTPLLKGLEIGKATVHMYETQELTLSWRGQPSKTHKHERRVATWDVDVSREEHWHDTIEETGQEGWVVNRKLPLPKTLSTCIQDCTVQGIRIRHKVRLIVALNNPDGHVSELRATLPVTIFISPNMPLDDDGNLVSQSPDIGGNTATEDGSMAPPGYGQHVLDQLYDNVDVGGILTPTGIHSGLNSPIYAQSRAGSSENLAVLAHHGGPGTAVTPAALSSRLQSMTLDELSRSRGGSFYLARELSGSGTTTPYSHHHYAHGPSPGYHHHGDQHADNATTSSLSSPNAPELLSRRGSEEDQNHHHSPHLAGRHPGGGPETPPAHTEYPSMEQLSKVPSYTTATRTPLHRPSSSTYFPALLPDYDTAMSSAPNTNGHAHASTSTSAPVSTPGSTAGSSISRTASDLLETIREGYEHRSRS